MNIDWAGIRFSGAVAADFNVPSPDQFPSSTWFTSNPNAWPVIKIHGVFSLPTAGRGMIIADSDFTISGSNMWNGIVMVGGALTSNGNNTTSGATFAGLNYLLAGEAPPNSSDDSQANGTKTYVYNSCNVSQAAAGLRIYKPWNNTWLDNVPVW